ncbi:MAG TPA: hypothetical protein VNH21_02820 [Steroidobacteraceae bacterium]|nr:hypothetical protein [Steroidobacteraceae bacterium]
MLPARHRGLSILLALLVGGAAVPAVADNDCVDFKWDVSKERALFGQAPVELTAGNDSKSAPGIVPNRLYKLRLAVQDHVVFSVPPGRKMMGTPAFAGLAALRIEAPGSYRVAIDLPLWIDVVSNGNLVQPTDYQGQHACSAPHKIVVFDLGSQPVILQFSNAFQDDVLLTVTAAPARKL